ncbi:hypothetical protein RHMOL_Rhmol13G0146400 [Rhododendron molle]|uniref:Uncharacterized protein n=1 Tax=Rhododendron molle TaxID=49168 RepID=A0ACC0L7M3_RHOML|nr:hypothetical protein RHMOL_Rhmol13G0146400 [Rhododendron molle]
MDTVIEGLDDYYEYLNQPAEEDVFCPQNYIIDESLSQPVVQVPDEPHVAVLNSEDLWGKAELVTAWVS